MNKIKEEVHLYENKESKGKFDLSKIKELINVNIKDIRDKLSKNNKGNKFFGKSEKREELPLKWEVLL